MKNITKYLLVIALLFQGFAYGQFDTANVSKKLFYTGHPAYETIKVAPVKGTKVKNVILMVGDGMGQTHLSAAWIANYGKMNVDNCNVIGLTRTYCSSQLITDSGAAGTALATGQKTKYHSVGVDPYGKPLSSLTDLAIKKGLGTGIVVTCNLSDATPSAFCAKNPDRDQEEDIAADYLKCNVDFIFGAGRTQFNNRKDKRNILDELKTNGYQVCNTWPETEQVKTGKVFSILEDGQLPLAQERGDLHQKASKKAIEMLSKNKNGFFAMIEGSRIDDCGHWNDLPKLIREIHDFDQTIGEVLKWAEKDGETLVVILSDHETGGFTITGGNLQKGEIIGHFSTGGHSGIVVPVYAYGPQAAQFTGFMENADIFKKIKAILNL
jgi:alkaline phosphatase